MSDPEDIQNIFDADGNGWQLSRYPHGRGGQHAGTPNLCFRRPGDPAFGEWRSWGRGSLKGLRDAISRSDREYLARHDEGLADRRPTERLARPKEIPLAELVLIADQQRRNIVIASSYHSQVMAELDRRIRERDHG